MKAAFPIFVGVAALAFVGYGLFAPQPSDEDLIKTALADSLRAGKEGRPGSVLELLSQNFTVNNAGSPGRGAIAKAIKDYKPDIEISNQSPTISGSSARIESPAKVSVSLPPMSLDIRQVNLDFQREDGRRLLFFPARAWKLTNVTVPDEIVNELSAGFGQ